MPSSIPQDLDAEAAAIGVMLLKREAIEPVREIISADYFWNQSYGNIFTAVNELYEHGDVIDATTVGSQMRQTGTWTDATGNLLLESMSLVGSTAHAYHYAKAVEHAHLARLVMRASQDALTGITDGLDPFEVSDQLMKTLLSLGTKEFIQQAKTILEMMESEESESRIIIDGLLKEDYRVILTARSGTGKSTFTKFVGYCASQGVHPFTRKDIPPIRVLAIDGENPMENILQTMVPLRTTMAYRSLDYDEERFKVWRRPGGLNIRNRRDRTDLQKEIAIHQPDLLVMGPAYKMGVTRKPKESWEEAAGEWLSIIDDLRTRYKFAVLIEAHTSKGEEMDPQGSAYITQWAETGLALQVSKANPSLFALERFRGDRLQGLEWPSQLVKDPEWLFRAIWN